jgi:hypothetical protein
MPNRRLFLLSSASGLLAACAQAPSQRLTDTTAPIQALRVYAWSPGVDDAFTGASAQALQATLARHGLPVASVATLARPFTELAVLEQQWAQASPATPASHALVLTQQRRDSLSSGGHVGTEYLRYEAVLWEASSRRLVWKATLASLTTYSADNKRFPRGERLAADALRGLAKAGLIKLAGDVPRNAAGEEIPPTWLPLSLLQ